MGTVPNNPLTDTQHQCGFLKQGQICPTGDSIGGWRNLEIEPFLSYTASKYLAAFHVT